MSKEDKDSLYVKEVLEHNEFSVELIPETKEFKTPDLKAFDQEINYFIEVARKDIDLQFHDLINQPKGSTLKYKTSSIGSLLRHKYRQLKEYPKKEDSDFSLIWILTHNCINSSIIYESLKSILYGIESLDGYTKENKYYDKICYYFYYSFFYRRKALDGVVISKEDQIELCVNTFSERYENFRYSKLYKLFKDKESLIDPFDLESKGEGFIADCDIPRKDVNSVVRYLKEKYKLKTPTIYIYTLVNFPLD